MSAPARLVLADPPWQLKDKLPGKGRGAAKHYDLLSAEEIARFALPPIAEDALLLLWRVASMPEEALRVCRAWGFIPKTEIVWVKTTGEDADAKLHFGMGRVTRAAHETCIIGVRGRSSKIIIDKSVRSVFFAPVREHSAKPESFYRLAERLTHGPRVEIFARGAPRPGWETYGREAWGAPEHA